MTAQQGTEISAFGLVGWRWLNAPDGWTASATGLRVTTDADTDFWRTTHYGFIRDTGHALLRDVGTEFRLTATFHGGYRDQYDQAGVLLRIDERNWIKAGIEFVDGAAQLSAVVTRDFSDWNVVPLDRLAGATESITIDLHRELDTVTVRYGWDGGKPEVLLRLAYFPPGVPAAAGPMCASPDGAGFPVEFSAVAIAAA